MAENFEGYELEFKSFMREYATQYDRFSFTQSGNDDENKKKMLENMRRVLSLAEKKYKNMEAEASYLKRENITAKLRKFLVEFEDAKRQFMNLERDFLDKLGKKNLMEKRNKNSHAGQKQDIKDRYIDANDKAYNQIGLLDDAHTDLLAAITTTNNSNQILIQDRERLLKVDEKNKNINRMLTQAGHKEDKIYNREIYKRCILWLAIIVLFITDVFLIINRAVH